MAAVDRMAELSRWAAPPDETGWTGWVAARKTGDASGVIPGFCRERSQKTVALIHLSLGNLRPNLLAKIMFSRRIRLWCFPVLALGTLLSLLYFWRQSLAREVCRLGPRARCVAAELSALELRTADLRGADLRRARWIGTQLENANLAGARLDGSLLIGTDLERANLRGASLRGVVCRSCDLGAADLTGADLRGADLEGSDMENAKLPTARLEGARLRGNDLESADLRQVKARGAEFGGANLGRARLSGAQLDGAHLQATDLTSARLDRARLVGADLQLARLGVRVVLAPVGAIGQERANDDNGVGALLEDTDLTAANLRHADLTGVVMLRGSLRNASLRDARTTGSRWLEVAFGPTRCPDGQWRSTPCPGFVVPRTASAVADARARVAWLRSLPWPRD